MVRRQPGGPAHDRAGRGGDASSACSARATTARWWAAREAIATLPLWARHRSRVPGARHLPAAERRGRARGARDGCGARARVHEQARRPDLHREARLARRRAGCGSGRARSCRGRGRDDGERLERFGPEQEAPTARCATGYRATSSATRPTSTGATPTPRARTRCSRRRAGTQSSGASSSAASTPRTSPTSSPRRSARRAGCSGAACARRVGRARLLALLPAVHASAYVSAGFVPTPETIRLIGHALDHGALPLGPKALALHARRHGLLLMRKLVFITQQVDPAHHALAATVPMIRALAGARRRAGRARRRRGRRGAPGERARAAVPRPAQGRPRPALRGGARARARARGPSASSRTCARSTRCSARRSSRPLGDPARPLVHALARGPDAASWPSGVSTAVVERRPPFLPARLAEGARDRPRDRPRRVRVPRPSAAGRRCGARARALLAGEGARRRCCARFALARPRARRRADVHGPTLDRARSGAPRASSSGCGRARLGDRVQLGGPVRASQVPELLAGERPAREQHARRRAGQGRLRGGGELRAGARVEPGVRHAASPTSCAFARDDPAELAARIAAFAERSADDRAALGRALRATVAREHSVESWAEGHPRS